MLVKLKQNESGEFYLDINDIADFYDIESIDSYVQSYRDGGIYIEFFDKDGKQLKPKEAQT